MEEAAAHNARRTANKAKAAARAAGLFVPADSDAEEPTTDEPTEEDS
jgi:hypothetical protein